MDYKEFTNIFKKQVFALTYQKQLEFALTICQRLYFDYQNFYDHYKWGNPELLMDAIRMSEESKNAPLHKTKIEAMINSVEAITPDTDEYGDEVGSCALNACVSVLHSLGFLLTKDPLDIFYIGIAFYDTCDFKLQGKEVLSEEQRDNHALIQEAKRYLIQQTERW